MRTLVTKGTNKRQRWGIGRVTWVLGTRAYIAIFFFCNVLWGSAFLLEPLRHLSQNVFWVLCTREEQLSAVGVATRLLPALHFGPVFHPLFEASANLSLGHVDEDVSVTDEGGVSEEIAGRRDHPLESVPSRSWKPILALAGFDVENTLVLRAFDGKAFLSNPELSVRKTHTEVGAHVVESEDVALLPDTGNDDLLASLGSEWCGHLDDTPCTATEIRFPESVLPEAWRHFLFGFIRTSRGGGSIHRTDARVDTRERGGHSHARTLDTNRGLESLQGWLGLGSEGGDEKNASDSCQRSKD
mmetsp:Transcript_13403/g.27126  ORF Transcript_13403/g.27126 Transcript_13403/m.27126 type:complete len:300 (+) Transcript_13403:49-948(+)